MHIAKRAGIPLKIAAAIDPVDQPFFEKFVKPEVDGKAIQFIGELQGKEKSDYLGNAAALLFPIRWNEPFGLVMPEAMATGTPVIATNMGSVSEIVEDGVTGYIVPGSLIPDMSPEPGDWKEDAAIVEAMTNSLKTLFSLSETDYTAMRKQCRDTVEKRFTIPHMVDEYEKAYQTIIKR